MGAQVPQLLEMDNCTSHLTWNSNGCRYWIQKETNEAIRWGILEAPLQLCQQMGYTVQRRCLPPETQLGRPEDWHLPIDTDFRP
jgi:hypothetical protein